jgi:hypothetical protein
MHGCRGPEGVHKRLLLLQLATLLALSSAAIIPVTSRATSCPFYAGSLKAEYASEPVLDVSAPRLSWKVLAVPGAAVNNVVQAAYQVRCANVFLVVSA